MESIPLFRRKRGEIIDVKLCFWKCYAVVKGDFCSLNISDLIGIFCPGMVLACMHYLNQLNYCPVRFVVIRKFHDICPKLAGGKILSHMLRHQCGKVRTYFRFWSITHRFVRTAKILAKSFSRHLMDAIVHLTLAENFAVIFIIHTIRFTRSANARAISSSDCT